MPSRLRVSNVRLLPGSLRDLQAGLVGYVQFTLNEAMRVDGVVLRRGQDGQMYLAYPAKRGWDGWNYFYLQPIDDAARVALERQVLAQLGKVVS